ncbi:MAG: hypothetical protein NUW24_07175 [Anaerolineae bacterium]|jgi:hypothetical protein|nr:hypothetical protein [Anaerolineae bacterium]MDH7475699.1 hypothetical protein [Anaerolineae bacterium]
MKETTPTMSDWQALYQAALEFKEIEAWTWMYDSDIFGVQDPVSGEIGYCCIMGALGEMFALAVYLGDEGLRSYIRMAAQPEPMGDFIETMEVALMQKCLMASFGARKELSDVDHQVIKSLGLKFRGKNAWPVFRSYRPACFPWYLTADEAKFLTLVLQQAREVSLRFRENHALLDPPQEDLWFVRVPEKTEQGLVWKDTWLTPTLLEEEIPVEPVDELRLARFKKGARRVQAVWEVDLFLSPTAVQEEKGERPYYPYMILLVDHESGFVLGSDIVAPGVHLTEFTGRFLTLAERVKCLPVEIWTRKEEIYDLLEPVVSRLGIELYMVDELEALREARTALWRFMGGDL